MQAIQISCQLCSNVDIKDSWAHQILQRVHKNFKWPIKIWKFACILMRYGPLVHFKGPSSFWARIIPVKIFILSIFQWPFYTGFTVHISAGTKWCQKSIYQSSSVSRKVCRVFLSNLQVRLSHAYLTVMVCEITYLHMVNPTKISP